MLLKAGADREAREGSTGASPLLLAAAHGHGGTATVLLEAGASVGAKDAVRGVCVCAVGWVGGGWGAGWRLTPGG